MINIQMLMIKRKKSINRTIDITTVEVDVTKIDAAQKIAVAKPSHGRMAAIENHKTNGSMMIVRRMNDAMIIDAITTRIPEMHGSTNDLGTGSHHPSLWLYQRLKKVTLAYIVLFASSQAGNTRLCAQGAIRERDRL